MAELSAQGQVVHTGATSAVDVNTVASPAPNKLGMKGYDVDGNEYVYVDFQESFVNGEWVAFIGDYKASQLGSASVGFVGLVQATVSASDRAGWVMVRGVSSTALATSGSSGGFPVVVAATTDLGSIATDGTSAQSVAITGILITASPDTCASTALSSSASQGIASVLLNYPFIANLQISTS
jgi:hypothetical protein